MKYTFISLMLIITTYVNGQFYNNSLNLQYIVLDTTWNDLEFVSKKESSNLCILGFVENFTHDEYINVKNYCTETDPKGIKIGLLRPKDIIQTFKKLEAELFKDTIYFPWPNYVLSRIKENNYILSEFEEDDPFIHKCSNTVTFYRMLIDESIPILLAIKPSYNDEIDGIVAFYDDKKIFRIYDFDGYGGCFSTMKKYSFDTTLINKAYNNWKPKHEDFQFFNPVTHCFSVMSHLGGIRPSYDENLSIESYNKINDRNNYSQSIYISQIKKYKKGELLRQINGKVFLNGSLIFFNSTGGVLNHNYNINYNDQWVTFYKEIELIEGVRILYDGRNTIVPYEGYFELVTKDGEKHRNQDIEITPGKSYKSRLRGHLSDIEIANKNNKFGLVDKLNRNELLPIIYDSIYIDREHNRNDFTLILAKKSKTFYAFNPMMDEVYKSKYLRDFVFTARSINILDNDCFHLYPDGTQIKKEKSFKFISDCGTLEPNLSYKLSDSLNIGQFNLYVSTNDFSPNYELYCEINLYLDSLKFLNNSSYTVDNFYNYKFSSIYGDVYRTFPMVGFLNDSIKIITLNRNVPPTFYILSSFQADEVKLNGPNQPIMYRQGKLWAFYGLNQFPKYKSISPFEYNYAKIELPNGKKGWINFNGEEFWE